MNSPTNTEPVRPRRRIWPWVVIILLSPFAVLGVAAVSVLTLNSDARALRREVMAASGGDWHTKVQLSVGGILLGTARTVLTFVHCPNIAEARLGVGAVKSASVGVYELTGDAASFAPEKVFSRADEVMTRRGWTRMVGVSEDRDNVLIYCSDHGSSSDRLDVCLAVVENRQLVVVSATVNADRLAEMVTKLAAKHGHPFKLAQVASEF
ncbi:MAG TPA: hypothetical protein VHD32_18875 [Candidatus Didemnitutus sp.]|nr:hypothetical protein [Candidatus Didemnitutus sp.]